MFLLQGSNHVTRDVVQVPLGAPVPVPSCGGIVDVVRPALDDGGPQSIWSVGERRRGKIVVDRLRQFLGRRRDATAVVYPAAETLCARVVEIQQAANGVGNVDHRHPCCPTHIEVILSISHTLLESRGTICARPASRAIRSNYGRKADAPEVQTKSLLIVDAEPLARDFRYSVQAGGPLRSIIVQVQARLAPERRYRAREDHPRRTSTPRRVEHVRHAFHICPPSLGRMVFRRGGEHGSQVKDTFDFAAFYRSEERLAVTQVSLNQFSLLEFAAFYAWLRLNVEDRHPVTALHQRNQQPGSKIPGSPGDQHVHRMSVRPFSSLAALRANMSNKTSEIEEHAKLQRPGRRELIGHQAPRGAGDAAKGGRAADVRTGKIEDRMVQNVGSGRSKPQPDRMRVEVGTLPRATQLKLLEYSEVEIEVAGTFEDAHTRVSGSSDIRRRHLETTKVPEVIRGLSTWDVVGIAAGDNVRPSAEKPHARRVVPGKGRRSPRARVPSLYAVQRPAAEKYVGESFHCIRWVSEPALPAPYRYLVVGLEPNVVARHDIAVATLEVPRVRILNGCRVSAEVGSRDVGERLGPCVPALERQARRGRPGKIDLECIVGLVAAILRQADVPEIRVDQPFGRKRNGAR